MGCVRTTGRLGSAALNMSIVIDIAVHLYSLTAILDQGCVHTTSSIAINVAVYLLQPLQPPLIRDVCAPLCALASAPRGGDAAVAALPADAMAAWASTSSSRASAFSSVPAHCSARDAASPAPLTGPAIKAH